MSDCKPSPIPPPHRTAFTDGITHPELWLWDAWTLSDGDKIDLYCLALARIDDAGVPTTVAGRNDYKFHVRRFTSLDEGTTWQDKGAYAWPGMLEDRSDERNIWSGSVLQLRDGRVIHGYTGIRSSDLEHPYIQSASVRSVSPRIQESQPIGGAFTCCDRDYDEIRAAGYYLGPRESLGDKNGEDGGPILCWRDPFLFEDVDGAVYAFLAAKTSPVGPAVAQIALDERGGEWTTREILPPIELPDESEFSQAEVPKVYFDTDSGQYFLLISSTNRIRENQPDSEVTKEQRLYYANSVRGPWMPINAQTSRLMGLNGLFGASLIRADFKSGEVTFIGPYSEMVDASRQLSFAPPVTLNIYQDRMVEPAL